MFCILLLLLLASYPVFYLVNVMIHILLLASIDLLAVLTLCTDIYLAIMVNQLLLIR